MCYTVYFVLSNITNSKFVSEGFKICTHTTSLIFDLTSDQEKLPRDRKKTFRRATEEDPSPGWTDEYMSCDQMEHIQHIQ